MGDVDDVHLKPEEIRAHVRELVEDADRYEALIHDAQVGLRSASTDAAPWFSAGGWGMFKQPATAADDADRFISQVRSDLRQHAADLAIVMRNLTDVDVTSSEDLDRIAKVVYPHE